MTLVPGGRRERREAEARAAALAQLQSTSASERADTPRSAQHTASSQQTAERVENVLAPGPSALVPDENTPAVGLNAPAPGLNAPAPPRPTPSENVPPVVAGVPAVAIVPAERRLPGPMPANRNPANQNPENRIPAERRFAQPPGPAPDRTPVGRTHAGRAASTPKRVMTKRSLLSAVVMTCAAALIATMALPAYAFNTAGAFDPTRETSALSSGQQSIASGADQTALVISRDDYKAPTQAELTTKKAAEAAAAAAKLAATLQLSSTGAVSASAYPSVVSPEVQALASDLMAAVASGRLVGSRPDHIKEIAYLASGQAVPNCGVDFRVLQTIKVAVDNFDKVGVSDINRLCTGQLEGAGTISPHYRAGGGHAVDFYILNGHSLTGGDSDSMKLLRLLDPMVPANTNVGQAGCRASGSGFVNLSEFADSCSHLHIDFISARGAQLSGV